MQSSSVSKYLEIEYTPSKCSRCGVCLEVCPFNVWELPNTGPAVLARPENCTNCTACANNCPSLAIVVKNLGCGCVWCSAVRKKEEISIVGSDASKCCE